MPRMTAGMPVKQMPTTDIKPSTKLAIALPLVPVCTVLGKGNWVPQRAH